MNVEARLLSSRMHDISENHWCAQWLTDCEYALWACLTGKSVNGTKAWELYPDELEELRFLHELAGGWCMWSEEVSDIVFVSTTEWLQHLALLQRKP